MWNEIESVGARALQSLKVRTAIVGGLVYLLIRFCHLGNDQAGKIADGVLQITSVLVGAQGLADFGKVGVAQAAQITAQVAVANASPMPQASKATEAQV